MTISEINSLTVEDVKSQLQSRCFSNKEVTPEYEESDGDYEAWYESQFTSQELEDELVVYKQELVAVETERLRKKDISDRFEGLSDMRLAFHSLHPELSNPALFLKELLEQEDHADAEVKISALEVKDSELKTERDSVVYMEQRKSEYPAIEELIVAMWEGDQPTIDAIEAARQAVKVKYPKP